MRRAGPDDARALGAVLSDWIDATPWMPRLHTRAQDAGFVAGLIQRAEVWCLPAADGFIAIDGPDIPALYLAPDARGRGQGGALLARAKRGRNRLALWVFQSNDRALRFYARHGFRQTAETSGDNAEGLPDQRMEWHQ